MIKLSASLANNLKAKSLKAASNKPSKKSAKKPTPPAPRKSVLTKPEPFENKTQTLENQEWVEIILENVKVVPKERQRFGKGFVYTSRRTVVFEGLLRKAGLLVMKDRPLLEGPTQAVLIIKFPIPTSWPKHAVVDALNGVRVPTRRADLDNNVKAILDGLNGVVYPDDAQIVEIHVKKIYAETPGLIARFKEMKDLRGGFLRT